MKSMTNFCVPMNSTCAIDLFLFRNVNIFFLTTLICLVTTPYRFLMWIFYPFQKIFKVSRTQYYTVHLSTLMSFVLLKLDSILTFLICITFLDIISLLTQEISWWWCCSVYFKWLWLVATKSFNYLRFFYWVFRCWGKYCNKEIFIFMYL